MARKTKKTSMRKPRAKSQSPKPTRSKVSLQEMAQISKLADIGILAAGVAHELNNPLMIVLGFAENLALLLEAPVLNREELKFQAAEIIRSSERMARIIRQMSRMVKSSEVDVITVEMHEMLETVLQFLNHEIKASRVEMNIDIHDNCLVRCDRNQIEQVILNVMSNALHAVEKCPLGQRQIHVACKSSDLIEMSIWNSGAPIPQNIQDKIMTPFFTTKEVGKGTGLGLPVSFGILKAHGGNLKFVSNAAQGTTFKIQLPIAHPVKVAKSA